MREELGGGDPGFGFSLQMGRKGVRYVHVHEHEHGHKLATHFLCLGKLPLKRPQLEVT